MILVELRCGEDSGRCGRLIGRLRKLPDGRYISEDRDGNGFNRTVYRDAKFGFPTCPRHRKQIGTFTTTDFKTQTPVQKYDWNEFELNLADEILRAGRSGKTVKRIVKRSDRGKAAVVDVSDLPE